MEGAEWKRVRGYGGGGMSKLHVNHVQGVIDKLLVDRIDLTDLSGKNDQELRSAFLTRGLAAYSLMVLAGTDACQAAQSITDGYEDNGLDAIFFDRNLRFLWIVQSKWIQSGVGSPDLAETLKFTRGIRDLVDFDSTKFNDKIRRKEKEVLEALLDSAVRIKLVFAYTGQELSSHCSDEVKDLMSQLNDTSELVTFHDFSLKEAHRALSGSLEGKPIVLEVALSNWGQVDSPYKAFYGQVSAADVATWWAEHRARLFVDNLRKFIGDTDVNESIKQTLQSEPLNFWYFNNGVTVLCSKIGKKPIGGGDKSTGYFVCEGARVVNGAQTVGCIGTASELQSSVVSEARVLVRLISLEGCPPDFNNRITRAANTQNRIEKQDFVTLDPIQEKLKVDLALEGVTYHYKRSEDQVVQDDKNVTLEDATVALACAGANVDLAVTAKREIGKLWESATTAPYTDLFNPNLTVTKLQRCVQVLRDVQKYLETKVASTTGRERSYYVHGNRFLLFLVFQKIPTDVLVNPTFEFPSYRTGVLGNLIVSICDTTRANLELLYSTSLIHQVFRNFTKCRKMKRVILEGERLDDAALPQSTH